MLILLIVSLGLFLSQSQNFLSIVRLCCLCFFLALGWIARSDWDCWIWKGLWLFLTSFNGKLVLSVMHIRWLSLLGQLYQLAITCYYVWLNSRPSWWQFLVSFHFLKVLLQWRERLLMPHSKLGLIMDHFAKISCLDKNMTRRNSLQWSRPVLWIRYKH